MKNIEQSLCKKYPFWEDEKNLNVPFEINNFQFILKNGSFGVDQRIMKKRFRLILFFIIRLKIKSVTAPTLADLERHQNFLKIFLLKIRRVPTEVQIYSASHPFLIDSKSH